VRSASDLVVRNVSFVYMCWFFFFKQKTAYEIVM